MAAVYGKQSTYDQSSLGTLRVSIEDFVGKYPKLELPLLNRIGGDIFEKTVDNTKTEWKEENLRPTQDKLGSALESTDGTEVVVETAGVFNKDDVVQVGSEHMVVTAVASDGVTLTVSRGWASTTPATALDEAVIRRIGIAAPEGADADGAVRQPLSDFYNYTQIFEDVVEMTDTEENAFIYRTKEGGSNSQNQIVTKQKELLQMQQLAYFFGRRHNDTLSDRRTTGGMKFFVDTYASSNAIDMGGASAWKTSSTIVTSGILEYTKAQEKIDDAIETIANNRGKPTAMYVGYKALRYMGLFGLNSVRSERKDTNRGITAVKTYTSQVGELDVVMIPGVEFNDMIFIVDEDKIGHKAFKNRAWFTKKLAENGDSHKWQVLGEYIFGMKTVKAGAAYLYNLGLS